MDSKAFEILHEDIKEIKRDVKEGFGAINGRLRKAEQSIVKNCLRLETVESKQGKTPTVGRLIAYAVGAISGTTGLIIGAYKLITLFG